LILVASDAIFLVLTALVALWARSIRDQFASGDDVVAPDASGSLAP
jgi:hypothetical protein